MFEEKAAALGADSADTDGSIAVSDLSIDVLTLQRELAAAEATCSQCAEETMRCVALRTAARTATATALATEGFSVDALVNLDDESAKAEVAVAAAKKAARQARQAHKRVVHELTQAKLAAAAAVRAVLPELIPGTVVCDCLEDPALDVYRDLKDSSSPLRRNLFIVEGPEPIRLLLESDIEIVSLLLKPTVYEGLRGIIEKRGDVCVLLTEHKLIGQVVGYTCRRGALACARIPLERDLLWLRREVLNDAKQYWRVLAVDGTNNQSNLGSLVRTASAMGVHAVLLSADCCDMWYVFCVLPFFRFCYHPNTPSDLFSRSVSSEFTL